MKTLDKNKMTYQQRTIRSLVIKYRNDYVGYNENTYNDHGETFSNKPSITDCEQYIYNQIMNNKDKYQYTSNNACIETKHIRFQGSEWLKALIHDRVTTDYNTHGWNFPHEK